MGGGGGNIIPKRSVCQNILSVQTPMYFLKGAVQNVGVSPALCQCYCNYYTGKKIKMRGAKEVEIS